MRRKKKKKGLKRYPQYFITFSTFPVFPWYFCINNTLITFGLFCSFYALFTLVFGEMWRHVKVFRLTKKPKGFKDFLKINVEHFLLNTVNFLFSVFMGNLNLSSSYWPKQNFSKFQGWTQRYDVKISLLVTYILMEIYEGSLNVFLIVFIYL